MSAAQAIAHIREQGASVALDGNDLVLTDAEALPATTIAWLRTLKPKIIAELRRQENGRQEQQHVSVSAPQEAYSPEPTWTARGYYGANDVPPRYRAAWLDLLMQCPPSVTRDRWAIAIEDAVEVFSLWGKHLVQSGWTPGDLFDVPNSESIGGLVWQLRGDGVTALGSSYARFSDGREYAR